MPPGTFVPGPGRVEPGAPGVPGAPGPPAPAARLPGIVCGVNAHSLYLVRPLNSFKPPCVLLLTTPTMPPVAPAGPRVCGSNGAGGVATGVVTAPAAPPPPG